MGLSIESLGWDGGAGIQHDVWTYWDGEDQTFDIADLAGLEQFSNIRRLALCGCQSVRDWSPAGRLPRLESLEAHGGRMDDLGALLSVATLKTVRLQTVEGKDLPANQRAIAALRARGVEGVWT